MSSELNDRLVPNDSPMAMRPVPVTSYDFDSLFSYPLGKINYTHLTASSRTYSAIVSLSREKGTFLSIQEAINYVNNLGGGTVFIRNGTYYVGNDLTLYSRVSLIGESFGGVIIVFTGAYSLKGTGSSVYSTGTVDITKGTTALVGNGTSWAANVTSAHTIVLNKFPYSIASVDSDTGITLSSKYAGTTLSGATYVSAVYISGNKVENIIISGTSTHGVNFSYVDLPLLYFVYASAVGGNGFRFTNCLRTSLELCIADGCGNSGIYAANTYLLNGNRAIMTNNASHGFEGDDVANMIFVSSPSDNNTTNGFNIINSTKYTLDVCEGARNGTHGLYTSASSYGQINEGGYDANGTDGVRIDANSDFNNVVSVEATGNGGFGVKINSADCTANIVALSQLGGNIGGNTSDGGTGSIIVNNQ